MQQSNEHHLFAQPDTTGTPSIPIGTQPKRHRSGARTVAIVALAVLLAVVFGIGLFAGWVFGTRGIPLGTTAVVTTSSTPLDALREAVVEKVHPAVVQVNV